MCGYIRGWCSKFSRFIRLQNDLIAGWSVWGAAFFRVYVLFCFVCTQTHPLYLHLHSVPFSSFPRARTHTAFISLYISWCELCEKHDTMYAPSGIVGHTLPSFAIYKFHMLCSNIPLLILSFWLSIHLLYARSLPLSFPFWPQLWFGNSVHFSRFRFVC